MMPTRLRAEFGPASRWGVQVILLVAATLASAAIACTRADVPVSGKDPSPSAIYDPSPTSAPIKGTKQPTALPAATAPALASETPTPEAPEPIASPTFPATPTAGEAANEPETLLYEAQSGDTLRAVAVRFGILPEDIESNQPLPEPQAFINPGQLLLIPKRLSHTGPAERLLPDSEVVFSPHATDFDVAQFVADQGGYLNSYREAVGSFTRSGAEVVEQVARDNSINPRLLLAFLEYASGWVTQPQTPTGNAYLYPLGRIDRQTQGLHRQLTWLASQLGNGYYGWRAGTLTEVRLADGTALHLAPDLNAGTVALQYFFSLSDDHNAWEEELGPNGVMGVYESLFGDPWSYEYTIFEPGVEQPPLILPFLPGHVWSFTGGPHGAWERESAWAALDFAPAASEPGCAISTDWAVAAAPGLIVRSADGVVVIDLDGDGREQAGWSLIYLHVAAKDRVTEGTFVETGDLIGHPSCEGGIATGSHIHLVRKYNGEWILADGPIPFTLDGWVAHAGSKPYQGSLTRDGEEVLACPCGSFETLIKR